MTTATVSPPRTRTSRPRRSPSVTTPSALRRLGLPLGFPLPPLTVPRSPPMTPVAEQAQTKEVEYYRAAPAAPGSYSVDLERVHPVVRPTRSPSDPPTVTPLSITKRTKAPPAAIIVPANTSRLEIHRPSRSPARQTSYFDPDVSSSSTHGAPKPLPPNRGPAPGPPPMGPLPPIPDQQVPFTGVDPLVLRAVSARERREVRRQSKTPDDKDIASLERSMRRLSRISLGASTGEMGERTSGPTSPTISVAGSLGGSHTGSLGRVERAEKLLRRISRQSDAIRLPSDYGRFGISGYSVPSSAPVSPGIRGVPSPLRPHKSETEASELAYLADERPSPALSVPMRRNVEHAHSAPGAYTPAISEPGLGLGLGLTLNPSDSMSSTMASTSMATLPSITSMSTLPSDATITTLPSESTIRPTVDTRPSRLGSLSSASSTAASIHSAQTFETASTSSLLTPISPPSSTTPLPKPPRSPMSPPRPLRMKSTIRLPSPIQLPSRTASPDIPSILAQFRETQTLPVPTSEVSSVPATRVRPGARPRVHSDLAPLDISPPVQAKQEVVGKPESMHSSRSSIDSRVAVEDSGSVTEHFGEESNVLEIRPRPSLESQVTPRMSRATRSSAATPTPKTASAPSRPVSPDISYILRTTPRPTRRGSQHSLASSSTTSRRTAGTSTGAAPPSSFRPTPGMAGPSRRGSEMSMTSSRRSSSAVTASSAGLDVEGAGPEMFFGEQYDSDDSDSDLDLSTPLPHMMLRAGLLSPRSTIITELMEPARPASTSVGLSARGEALRLKGEKVWKAETKRKVRHRDGRNLRDGVGLTTGLGWSDSEDEDAPSPLRRRLSSVLLAKAQAQAQSRPASSRPASQLSRQSTTTLSRRSTYSNLDSTSVSSQSLPRTPASHPLSLPLTPSSLPGAAQSTDEFGKLDFPLPPTATTWRLQPSPALQRLPSNPMMRSASTPVVPAVPPTPSSLRTRTTSSASSATSTSALRTPARSKMPTPTPRPSKINVRSPSGTRLSAPEALREAGRLVSDGSRRLSGA